MPLHTSSLTRFPLHALALSLALGLSAGAARADEVSDAQALLAKGNAGDALKKVDQALVAKPNDPRLRLQRGNALAQLKREPEAIAVFQKLIETNPELPGPYNNLAVLYGNQGDFEKARQALELAIRTNPSYATAFQNLGDVYARLAGQAYKKALALDKGDNQLPLKLAVVQNVFEPSVDPRAAKAAAVAPVPAPTPAPAPVPAPAPAPAPAAAAKATTPPAVSVPAPAPVVQAKAAAPAPVVASAPATTAAAKPAAATPVAKPEAPKVEVAKAEAAKPNPQQESQQAIEKAVQNWAKAWSRRDMDDYYKAYTPDFKGKAATRKAWEEDRRVRIMGKKKIAVEVSGLKIKVDGDGNKATVTFRQNYTSDALSVKSSKTLNLVKSKSGAWLLSQESSS
ncbi:nuclear transport factor 2 family protein [Roseateles sp. PN1]|uniref:nuclear transport factor 2 family protein n=1 Tax=Roseateles sp. PN1 TaxID=3137372 RepID=UPI0031398A1B